jgi:hypothetical protein
MKSHVLTLKRRSNNWSIEVVNPSVTGPLVLLFSEFPIKVYPTSEMHIDIVAVENQIN